MLANMYENTGNKDKQQEILDKAAKNGMKKLELSGEIDDDEKHPQIKQIQAKLLAA